ncbi:MAG: PAS domain S-box protein [Campylobacterota bacterium]|nr:PAS domain S-box protein [Campylobacterota bacterium]
MNNITPVDEEHTFQGDVIISQTDLDGIITYANRAFAKVSGYKTEELIGQSHNIIRHPDMPKAVFSRLWETISGGQAWNGLIKNIRKDGLYYWVETEILPISDETGNITGYIAVRKEASKKDINEIQETYTKMLETQK